MTKYNHYEIHVEVKTPIFIGSGDKITKKEYAYDDNSRSIYIIDNNKLIDILLKEGKLSAYERHLLDNKSKDMMKWLKNMRLDIRINEFSKYVLTNDISMSNVKSRGQKKNKNYEILTFIKDSYGKPYIPGSTLKGAIRTAIIGDYYLEENHAIDDNFTLYQNEASSIISSLRQIDKHNRRKNFELKKIFRYYSESENNDVFREDSRDRNSTINQLSNYILVSDSHPIDMDSLVLSQKVDLTYNNKEIVLPIYRECLATGTKFKFTISIPETIPFSDKEFPYNIDNILLNIHNKNFYDLYVEYLDQEKSLDKINSIFRLGGGVGFQNKTTIYPKYGESDGSIITSEILDILFPNKAHLDDNVSPRVRKMTYYENILVPMGICDIYNVVKI